MVSLAITHFQRYKVRPMQLWRRQLTRWLFVTKHSSYKRRDCNTIRDYPVICRENTFDTGGAGAVEIAWYLCIFTYVDGPTSKKGFRSMPDHNLRQTHFFSMATRLVM